MQPAGAAKLRNRRMAASAVYGGGKRCCRVRGWGAGSRIWDLGFGIGSRVGMSQRFVIFPSPLVALATREGDFFNAFRQFCSAGAAKLRNRRWPHVVALVRSGRVGSAKMWLINVGSPTFFPQGIA